MSGSLYHKTQLDFSYNTNHIKGFTITFDETASIYDTGTILTSKDKVIVLKAATEFYIRGIRKYQTNNEKDYLIDTCLNSQDNYKKRLIIF